MPASLTTVNSITKEIYQGRIRTQLQDEVVGLKRIEKTSEGVESQVGGRYVTFPIRVRRNHGIGYRNELEQLQAGGQQGYASVRVGLKYGYGRVRLSGQLIELADTNYQAFSSAMDLEMTGLKNDIAKDSNRIFYGDGKGTIGTVDTLGTTVNTVDLKSTQYVEVGEQVDVLSSDGVTTRASNRQITAVNTTTGVITVDGAAFSTSVGDIVKKVKNSASPSSTGFGGIC